MTRRKLDIGISIGGVLVAVLFLAFGFVMQNQASFAQTYVKQQLSEQKILFTSADKLSNEEKSWKDRSNCLVQNAGKLLASGRQAECYANYYIALHLEEAAARAGYPGETYASIGSVQTDFRAKIADARTRNDTQATELQKNLDAVNALRETQFRGETLRGLLLTSYGFSVFGERAALAAAIGVGIAAVAAILAVAGFIHAFKTSETERVFVSREPVL